MNSTIRNCSFNNNSILNYQVTPSIFHCTNASAVGVNYRNFVSPLPPPPRSQPTLVAIPLPHGTCSSCNAEIVENLSRSTIQIPIQVSTPAAGILNNTDALGRLRRVGENPLLEPPLTYLPPPPAFQYVPPQTSGNGNGIKQRLRLDESQQGRNFAGLNKWFIKRRQSQLQTSTVSKNRSCRAQKMLKRLQNHSNMRQLKVEKRQNYEEIESIRESKLEMLRRKGIKAPPKTECPLWNCPRKEYKRYCPFLLRRKCRSVSSLSNLSEKSRSPIIFRRAP